MYDILNLPDQNELSKHCHHNRNLEKDLEITILDYGYDRLEERERLEDIYICKLQTHQCSEGGMSNDTHTYVKEMYDLWSRIKCSSATKSQRHI